MNQLTVPFLKDNIYDMPTANVKKALSKLDNQAIDNATWAANFPYKPSVHFTMAYSKDCIVIEYFVEEKAIRAVNNTINGSIWEDTCVEFFVSWDNGASYYNLEFNCLGIGLIGFGHGRDNRERLSADLIRTIKTDASIQSTANGFQWSLLLVIPLSIFKFHNLGLLKGKSCRANFYKCGDQLPEPHFLSWSPITFHKPNFHLPEFFGELVFK